MTHPLHQAEISSPLILGKPWAAVMVEHKGGQLVITDIKLAKRDVQWAELPARLSVVDQSGKTLKPSKGNKFFISLETFDPFHLVCEYDGGI